ncbi:MAG: CDP-alcohol phosphatidyltransferase family protein [Bacteroidota bacterium]
MLSRWARRWTPQLFLPMTNLLIRLRVTPNGLTTVGLVLAVLCGWLIVLDRLIPAAGCLILSGLLDSLDGELARRIEREHAGGGGNRLGPFIDSAADHYGDFAVYFGLAWRAMHLSDQTTVYLVLLAMFGSLVGSHIRSRAGMVGVDTKNVGSFTRMERTLVLLAGLLSGWVKPAVGLLAVLGNVAAIQRFVYVVGKRRIDPLS